MTVHLTVDDISIHVTYSGPVLDEDGCVHPAYAWRVTRKDSEGKWYQPASWMSRYVDGLAGSDDRIIGPAYAEEDEDGALSTFVALGSAAAEAYWAVVEGRESENINLFPASLTEAFYLVSDELGMALFEREEEAS